MERKHSSDNPEAGWESQVIADEAIKREDDHNNTRKSRRKQILNTQDAFGIEANPVEIGNLLGITEDEIRRYISRRGIRNEEYEPIQERLNDYHTIALLLTRVLPEQEDFSKRRKILFDTNRLITEQTGINPMKTGKTHLLVEKLEATFEFQNREHPDSL